MIENEEIGRDLTKLAIALLMRDLNWSLLMKMPLAKQLDLAASAGMTPEQVVAATEQLGRLVKARIADELSRTPPSVGGGH